jgi:Mg-chelatase subunit ChlD
MDIADVATHEFGHFEGSGDMYLPGYIGWDIRMGTHNEDLTMYGIIRKGETKKRTLEAGDVAGIKYVYTHSPKSAIDIVLLIDASASFAATYNGLAPSKNSATELVQKLRADDRVTVIKLPNQVLAGPTTVVSSADSAAVVNAINGITTGATPDIGLGMQTGQSLLASSVRRKAMILFSSGEGLGNPLSVVPSINADSIKVYTLGF